MDRDDGSTILAIVSSEMYLDIFRLEAAVIAALPDIWSAAAGDTILSRSCRSDLLDRFT
jgi:hypothetical protein